jgi:V/A-type H+/Na+-transporting ATPase subunit E
MAEQLQQLIEQIEREGVERAEAQAREILSQAKDKAAKIVREAEEEARRKLEQAERDAELYTQRSTRALEQAARDVLITVGQGVENILSDIVAESVDEALSIEVLEKMMVKMAESCAQNQADSRIELLIGEKDQRELIKFFADRYREKMVHGLELHVDTEILKGCRVSFRDERVYIDFTAEAISESLSAFLRPHLAELVSRVARERAGGSTGGNGDGD